ncbi:hypothetical protein T11_577 [Trichinella zimbabwensis]|uniref:Uncharacterized protein n=1 Tax=Trichinella zimbabwensis TaxID=268475 RepID=A0A0V1H2C3_9BILA|nr:hypothetical protein T11_577 [Trichinella zimbabwensis]
MVLDLFWQRMVMVLPARLSTKYGPSYVGERGGRGASFCTKTCVHFFSSLDTNHFRDGAVLVRVGRMESKRIRRWSLRAAAFDGSVSVKNTPGKRSGDP